MPLSIQRVDPLRYAAPLKELMTAHDYSEFPTFFDVGYPAVVRDGGATWVGVDETGGLQMSITNFRHDFMWGERRLRAGMIGNLMVAAKHRTFFPAVQLVRRLLKDTRAEGQLDFIYTDPNPGATATMKGAGLTHVGDIDRFVLPIGEREWYADTALAMYTVALAGRRMTSSARLTAHDAASFDAAKFAAPSPRADRLLPEQSVDLYRRRLAGYPSAEDRWFLVHRGRGTAPVGALLVRGPDAAGLAIVHAVRRTPALAMEDVIPPLARALRRMGGKRLQIETVRESRFADELRRAGLRPRNDLVPVFAIPFTEAGDDAVRAIDAWEITALDMER